MTSPENDRSVGGAHPETQSSEKMASRVSFRIDTSKSLSEVSNQIINSADWHFSAFTDENRSAKYASDPSISYFGDGSFSLNGSKGGLIFGSNINEANRGAFRLDHGGSSFYSSLEATTLGSLKIDTVDGHVLNPLSPVQPSTNYSPTKPWIKKLFPTLATKDLTTIAVLAIVQASLAKLFSKGLQKLSSSESENIESKKDVDIATIIVDNQEIENKILGIQ